MYFFPWKGWGWSIIWFGCNALTVGSYRKSFLHPCILQINQLQFIQIWECVWLHMEWGHIFHVAFLPFQATLFFFPKIKVLFYFSVLFLLLCLSCFLNWFILIHWKLIIKCRNQEGLLPKNLHQITFYEGWSFIFLENLLVWENQDLPVHGDDLAIQKELVVGYSMISSSNEQQDLYFPVVDQFGF